MIDEVDGAVLKLIESIIHRLMLLRKLLSLLEQGIAIDLFVNIFVRIQGLNIAGIGLSLDFR